VQIKSRGLDFAKTRKNEKEKKENRSASKSRTTPLQLNKKKQ